MSNQQNENLQEYRAENGLCLDCGVPVNAEDGQEICDDCMAGRLNV